MDRVSLSPSLDLSRIVYGMWRVGDDSDTSPSYIEQKINACLEVGITSIDQADIYGDYGAEALLGDCLAQAPGLRDKVEIITKCDIVAPIGKYAEARVKYYDTSRVHILQSVENSLANMRTDRIDLLLIHRPDPYMDHDETGAALDEVIASGKVLNVGVSNFKEHDFKLLQSATKAPLVTNQIEINPLNIDSLSNGDIAFLQQRKVPPMAWSPLGGGALFSGERAELSQTLSEISDRYDTDIANIVYAWLLVHPARIIPVLGTNKIERIQSAAKSVDIRMDRQTWFEIYTAALGREVA